MVDWIYTVQAGGWELFKAEKTLLITAASGWSGGSRVMSAERLMLGASIQIPPREFSLTVTVACNWVTARPVPGVHKQQHVRQTG